MRQVQFILSLFFLLIPFHLEAQTFDIDELIDMEKRAFNNSKNFVSNTTGKDYDIKYHRFNWQIDPNFNAIQGSVFTLFQIKNATSVIEFDLNNNMVVDSVLYHSQSKAFSLSNNILSINLVTNLALGVFDSIQVFYHGSPVSSLSGSWFKGSHSTGPIISTLSEPYGAKDWWPCKQNLNDKIDSIDIYVKTLHQYKVASNGVLIERKNISGNMWEHHWKHKYPIAFYLIAISVSNYEEFSNYYINANGDSLEILNYCYPQSLSQWQNQGTIAVNLMHAFDSLLGPYPFRNEKYGHAQWEWGGGMEHQTMSFMSNLNFMLNAHELGHQWFGNMVTCASWQDVWLNEGFATYLVGLAFEMDVNGGASFWPAWKSGTVGAITSQSFGSVYVDDTTLNSRIFDGVLSYNKGAYLLHMLRWKIGDADFFQGLRNYLNDSSLAYGFAKTDDLKYHLEQVSGQNLTEFFNDWFYGQGYPQYSLQLENNSNNNYDLTVNQNQSHSSVNFFEMPIEVQFIGASQDTTIVFDHNADGQVFNIDLGFEIVSFNFDPELWICASANTILGIDSEIIETEISIYPNPAINILNIKLSKKIAENGQFSFLDNKGNLITAEVKKVNGKEFKINTDNWPAGLYYCQYTSGKIVLKSRFIIVD